MIWRWQTHWGHQRDNMCAVYWVLNLYPKYCFSLHSILLALLCKTNMAKEHGCDRVLYPFIWDIVSLEKQGVYIEQLGASIKIIWLLTHWLGCMTASLLLRYEDYVWLHERK